MRTGFTLKKIKRNVGEDTGKKSPESTQLKVLWVTLWVTPSGVCLSWGHLGIFGIFPLPSSPATLPNWILTSPKFWSAWAPLLWGAGPPAFKEKQTILSCCPSNPLVLTLWALPLGATVNWAGACLCLLKTSNPSPLSKGAFFPSFVKCISIVRY